jgi:hypothetical protein
MTVGEASEQERALLLPLAKEGFPFRDAQLPRLKTLEDFDFGQAPRIPAPRVRELAEGGYIERSEPVVFIGECDPATFCTSLLHD